MHEFRHLIGSGEHERPFRHIHLSILACPHVNLSKPNAVHAPEVVGSEALINACFIDHLFRRRQQCFGLLPLNLSHRLDTEPISEHSATQTWFEFCFRTFSLVASRHNMPPAIAPAWGAGVSLNELTSGKGLRRPHEKQGENERTRHGLIERGADGRQSVSGDCLWSPADRKIYLDREAIKDRTHVFYQATRVTSSLNLESFKAEVAHGLGADNILTGLADWLAVLHYLARSAEQNPGLTIALDEFPYLAPSFKSSGIPAPLVPETSSCCCVAR
jgi:hypothetical protein